MWTPKYRYVCSPRHGKTLYIAIIIVILMKMLRSEATAGVICLPRMPLTVPELQNRIPTESTQHGHEITIRDFN